MDAPAMEQIPRKKTETSVEQTDQKDTDQKEKEEKESKNHTHDGERKRSI